MKTPEPTLVSIPEQLISIEKARELNENFIASKTVSETFEKEDANALWYSLESLENYIAYIKTEGIAKGYIVDGIRFYFGKYASHENEAIAGYSTLFLSPTGVLNTSISKINTTNSVDSKDITVLQPMNFGHMGNPPKMYYGEQ